QYSTSPQIYTLSLHDALPIYEHLYPGLPAVSIDPEQFKRVVVNLVDNAAEAMQDSLVKEIRISTRPGTGDTVELVVADTGCGVSDRKSTRLNSSHRTISYAVF